MGSGPLSLATRIRPVRLQYDLVLYLLPRVVLDVGVNLITPVSAMPSAAKR